MQDVVALVMAGGRGTRLAPLTNYFQKAMLPVGYRFRPVIEYVVRNLIFNGIKKIVIAVSYLRDQVVNYFRYLNLGNDVKIEFVEDPGLGTGTAFLKAFRSGLLEEEKVLVHYGDILTNLRLSDLVRYHHDKDCDCTLVDAHGYRLPIGIVKLQNEQVLRVVEKPLIEVSYGIGIFIFTRRALNIISRTITNDRMKCDIAKDIVTIMINQGFKVCAFKPAQQGFFWIDIGFLDTYRKLDHCMIDELFKYLF